MYCSTDHAILILAVLLFCVDLQARGREISNENGISLVFVFCFCFFLPPPPRLFFGGGGGGVDGGGVAERGGGVVNFSFSLLLFCFVYLLWFSPVH